MTRSGETDANIVRRLAHSLWISLLSPHASKTTKTKKRMKKSMIAFITLALAASGSTACAQTLVWSDDFDDPLVEWTPWGGQINEVNRQFVVSGSFGPFQTNNPLGTHAAGIHSLPSLDPLTNNQTLELRADLVGTNRNDAWAGLHFLWRSQGQGYIFFKDQDEIELAKFWNSASSVAVFFYENLPLKNQNVTLVLALTRRGSNVEITTRVLDKDNANAVLYTRTVTDTPQADPVLPSGTVRGMASLADLSGTPWPIVTAPTGVELTLQWVNSQAAPTPPAQVTYDNLEVWQYESPLLVVQRAVVLSWPLTQTPFEVQGAPTVNGPWQVIPDPWSCTNNDQCEVSILATNGLQFFRLRPAGDD
jgi:hypothetical protein